MGRRAHPKRHDSGDTEAASATTLDLYAVSYHAVTRYVQRILQVALEHDKAATERAIAEQHCAAAGTTIEEIRRLIMTPAIAAACALGAATVGTSRFRAVISAKGVIVTIDEPWKVRSVLAKHRLRLMSRAESQRKAARLYRRGVRTGEEQ